eukprot:12256683-Alexandrium_andersonii.AAC.1
MQLPAGSGRDASCAREAVAHLAWARRQLRKYVFDITRNTAKGHTVKASVKKVAYRSRESGRFLLQYVDIGTSCI